MMVERINPYHARGMNNTATACNDAGVGDVSFFVIEKSNITGS
jgi:hypothetical protein